MVKKIDTVQLLEAALRASSVKQATIANNIANIDTPNFRRSDVQFQEMLDKAVKNGRLDADEAAASVFQPMDTPVNDKGNDVNIDIEIGELIKNDGTYRTMMRLMTKTYRQMELAMGGGSI